MYKRRPTILRQLLFLVVFITIFCLLFAIVSSARSLFRRDFIQISEMGFSDPNNSWAWSMTWFLGKLYVGTGRNFFELAAFAEPPLPFDPYPVPVPDSIFDLDLRAEIWQYTPETDTWRRVYQSPEITIELEDGATRKIARDVGYRSMIVFTEEDGAETLYVTATGLSAHILRTKDGENFQTLSIDPGMEIPEEVSLTSFRSLVEFNGRLYTTPVATSGGAGMVSEVVIVLESVGIDLPASIFHFQPVSPPGFGDETNATIYEMAKFNGYLYAGTGNKEKGYQIWKTDASGEPPYIWTPVIMDGAYRGKKNQVALSMFPFKDRLYVGSGIRGFGYDPEADVFGQPELIRINSDDTWQLICGERRLTPDGFKFPLSLMGPGFDNVFNCYFWRMEEHDGWLYLSTMDNSVLLLYLPLDKLPPLIRKLLELIGVDRIVRREGGFDLFKSRNGVIWYPVATRGLGNPLNYGIRTLQSTPEGLFAGTTNPFTVGDRTHHFPNLPGGAEVWLGKEGGLEEEPITLQANLLEDKVKLSWTSPKNGEKRFHIYRSDFKRFETEKGKIQMPLPFEKIDTTKKRFFFDTTITFGAKYRYYVSAEFANGEISSPSNIVVIGIKAKKALAAAALRAEKNLFLLGQNFPNPINPGTWIPYKLPKASYVTIQIHDANGRLIREIYLGRKPKGVYNSREKAAYWDGKNEAGERVSNGIYFYTLRAGKLSATKKLVVVK